MSGLLHDVRYALRQWRIYPISNLIAVAILAIGIGVNTANFSFVNALLLRPLDLPKPSQLYHLYLTDPVSGVDQAGVGVEAFQTFAESSNSFASLGAYDSGVRTVDVSSEDKRRWMVCRTTPNLMGILGAEPEAGRLYTDSADDRRAVLISHSTWMSEFGGEDVLGRTLTIDRQPHTIVGVMPKSFEFPLLTVRLWMPMDLRTDADAAATVLPVGRLADGGNAAGAREELNGLFQRVEEERLGEETDRRVRVVPLREALVFLFDMVKIVAWIGTFAHLLILFIICANISGVLLVRAVTRERETALRTALGAGPKRLVVQFLIEGLLLAVVGGILGVGLAYGVTALLDQAIPPDLFRVGEIGIDFATLGFTFAVTLAATLFASLVPSLYGRRVDLNEALKDSGKSATSGRRSRRLNDALVVAQITLAVVLLVATFLLLRSFLFIQDLDPGFQPKGLYSFAVSLPSAEYETDADVAAFHRRLSEELDALPGVESAAPVNPLPLNFESYSANFVIDGYTSADGRERQSSTVHYVGPGFFETMRIPLVQGRGFGAEDDASGRRVVVVNRAFVERYWPEGALGKQLRLPAEEEDAKDETAAVVGVVENSKSFLMNEADQPILYLPQAQAPQRFSYVVLRSDLAGSALTDSVRERVKGLDAELRIGGLRSVDAIVGESMQPFALSAATFGGLGLVAALLAMMGLYGVVAYSVRQNLREVGIRMALGAQPSGIMRLVLRHGAVLTGLGLGIGFVIAFLLSKALSSLLFGVDRFDVVSFLAVAALLGLMTFLATFLPARRATKVDPMTILRVD